MKKIFKKFIVVLLLILVLLNFSFTQYVSHADAGSVIEGLLGSFIGIITWIFRLPAVGVAWAANALTADLAYGINGETQLAKDDPNFIGTNVITPFEIFFNRVQIFDVNFFDFDKNLEGTPVYTIRTEVAKWFYIMRLLAIAILLIVLIYVGIRMAITSVAEDKARYKQMLIDWATSLALVFVLQYIIIFTVNINNALVNAIGAAATASDGTRVDTQIKEIASMGLSFASSAALGAAVVFCMIVWQTFGFVLAYLSRTIKIAFLIIISPLISITYSIDKMGDGKSQALNAWLKEFVYTILMQPFHCVIYVTIVDIAFSLLTSPKTDGLAEAILAIVCIKFVKTAEDLIRKIFAFDDDNKDTSLAGGTAAAAIALSKAKNIGQTTRKGINMFKESKITDSLKKDTTKVRAAVRAIRGTKEDREAAKKGEKPSFAARMKREEGKIIQARENKKEEKANKKAWKMYQKHKDNYSEKDKSAIYSAADKLQKDNPKMSRKDAIRTAATKMSREKIASGAYKNKYIRGAKGFIKAVNNSETAKFFKNTVIPVGFGLGIAAMDFGGDANAFEAGMLGIAAGKSVGEFMKGSTNTLSTGIAEHLRGKGIYSSEDAEKEVMKIKIGGDNGNYDDDALKKKKDNLQGVLGYTKAMDVKNEIDSKFRKGEFDFDITELLKDILKIDSVDDSTVDAAKGYKDFRHDMMIYQTIGNGENVGISAETLANKAAEELDIEFNEHQFIESAKETVISKETVKAFKYREDYDLETIKNKLLNEIKKVEKQIDEIETQKLTMGTPKEINAANKNIKNLETSKDMLEENIRNIEGFEESIEEGTF